MFRDLVLKNRSYRRYDQAERVTEETLRGLVELARNTPSAANRQALRFRPVWREEDCVGVFATLGWAAQLKDWPGPEEGERPAAYILVLVDRKLAEACDTDVGIAAQTILLGAVELGLGGCMLGNVRRQELIKAQKLDPERYALPLVIALGKPKETVSLVEARDGDTHYYRDAEGVHYVPKRPLDELIV